MSAVSTWRMYLLRGMYLLISTGLAITVWPWIVAPPDTVANANTVIRALPGALAVVSLLGLRLRASHVAGELWHPSAATRTT